MYRWFLSSDKIYSERILLYSFMGEETNQTSFWSAYILNDYERVFPKENNTYRAKITNYYSSLFANLQLRLGNLFQLGYRSVFQSLEESRHWDRNCFWSSNKRAQCYFGQTKVRLPPPYLLLLFSAVSLSVLISITIKSRTLYAHLFKISNSPANECKHTSWRNGHTDA